MKSKMFNKKKENNKLICVENDIDTFAISFNMDSIIYSYKDEMKKPIISFLEEILKKLKEPRKKLD